ncbi:hypothetical protein CVO96_17000 [Deinococcus koreensis]|uniref:Uncharacterized protein n=1 Tax=Deinococcus koreensis TaxID=2054903 RepID=A0A2K3USZ6_9DEIO|nr:hypothetical protein CVO96_17000 [Deinococcus koreensis]
MLMLVLGLSAAQAQTNPAVAFPETKSVAINSSVCEQKRRASLGDNTNIISPGGTIQNITVTYNALPCPTTWLAQMTGAISTSQLPKYISALAFAVWFLGIIWSGIRIANGSEKSDGRELFARLLISGWLVFGSSTFSSLPSEPKFTGNMGEFVRASWVEAYKWGDATFATPAMERAAKETKNLGDHITKLVMLYGSLQVVSEAAKGGVEGAKVGTVAGNPLAGGLIGMLFGGAQGIANAATVTSQVGILAMNMAMPILITYYLIIMGTGLATVIASLLIPLVGAMFIFSTNLGMQYVETWFKTVASAVLMMAFMPIVFAGSMELGFVEPARNFDVATTRTERSLQTDFDNLTRLEDEGKINWTEELARKAVNIVNATVNKVDFVGFLNAMVTSLILMVFSLMAGVYLLRIAQNWIIEFLSGVAAAVAGGGGGVPKMGLGGVGSSVSAVSSGVRSAASLKAGNMSMGASATKSAPTNSPTMASAGSTQLAGSNTVVSAKGLGSGGRASNSGPSGSVPKVKA